MGVCKKCFDRLDDIPSCACYKCEECGYYGVENSNIAPKICEACADELNRCRICNKDLDIKEI